MSANPDMSKPLKILVVGSLAGDLANACKKVRGIHKKHGFDMILCSGDLLNESSLSNGEWDQLLQGSIQLPIPLLFTCGKKGLPGEILDAFDKKEGVLHDVFQFLHPAGVYVNVQGLRIAYLGGSFESGNEGYTYSLDHIKLIQNRVDKLKDGFVDILLTNDWPSLIEKESDAASKTFSSSSLPKQSPHLPELVSQIKPRYHFTSGDDLFLEREPFSILPNGHTTRFISLGHFGSPSGAKWFYAINIVPAEHADEMTLGVRPPNSTRSPFHSRTNKRPNIAEIEDNGSIFFQSAPQRSDKRHKKGHGPPPEGYTCRICNVPGHWIQECPEKTERQKKAIPDSIANRDASQCWFCLSNPSIETHLIVTVISDTYISLAKGGLSKNHLLIVPVEHVSSTPTLERGHEDPDAAKSILEELERVKQSLYEYFNKKGMCVTMFEIYGGENPNNPRMHHMHLQIVPLPKEYEADIEPAFTNQAERLGYVPVPEKPGSGPFVWFQVSQNAPIIFVPGDTSRGFNLFLPRQILANVIGRPEAKNWKYCVLPQEEEEAITEDLRGSIETLFSE